MIEDYYKTLTKVTVTRTPDGGGSYTETTAETEFRGYIALLSVAERVSSEALQIYATSRLFTKETLTQTDRVIDGDDTYEVVGVYNFFHKYYDLKRIQ